MSYRITNIEALKANLAATGNMLTLCRANIGRITISEEERADTLWRIERQIAELNAMRLEIVRPKKRASQVLFGAHSDERNAANN